MAKGPTIDTITAAFASASKLNANFTAIDTAFDNTLSLDGSTPNALSTDLDLGSNDVLNAGNINATTLTVGGVDLSSEVAAAAASASAASTSETNASSSESAASSSASAAAADAVLTAADLVLTDADQSAAATSESNASTSASTATTQASNASTSASTATTQASNASTSASNASTSESNASSSASAASTSETNAATSETNAAASFDEFDDIYLGAKANDPTLDNDGNALATGALYFNTGTDLMRVYSGSSWADIAPAGGTVSSIGIADAGATEITVTNSPVTTSGTIDLAIATIAGTKINFSGGGDLDAEVVASVNKTDDLADAADYRAATAGKFLDGAVWSSAAEVTISFGDPTTSVDMDLFINGVVTLTANTTLANPSNKKVGQSGFIRLVQDVGGTNTVAFGSEWDFSGGTAPSVTLTGDAQDMLFYTVISSSRVIGSLVADIS